MAMSRGSLSMMSCGPSRSAMSSGSWSALPGPSRSAMSSGSRSALPDPSGSAMSIPSGRSKLEISPLVPPVLTDYQKIEYLMKETKSQKKEHMKVREFTKIWCTRDLVICAREIWKWSIMKHLGDISNGRQLREAGVLHFVLMSF